MAIYGLSGWNWFVWFYVFKSMIIKWYTLVCSGLSCWHSPINWIVLVFMIILRYTVKCHTRYDKMMIQWMILWFVEAYLIDIHLLSSFSFWLKAPLGKVYDILVFCIIFTLILVLYFTFAFYGFWLKAPPEKVYV